MHSLRLLLQRWLQYVTASVLAITTFLAGFGMSVVTHGSQALIISQVQITGGAGQANNDFIELFNPNGEPFNLNGYRLVKRSATGANDISIKSWSTDTFIPPYSFYVWANAEYTNIVVAPDITTAATLAGDNGVGIRQGALDTGLLVDSIAWGQSNNGFMVVSADNPAAGQSLRHNDVYDAESGFSIGNAEPRNSTIQQLPEDVPDPDPLINDSTCTAPESVVIEAGESFTTEVSMQNTGTSTWTADTYSLFEPTTQTVIPVISSILPTEIAHFNVVTTLPIAGSYQLMWKMQHGDAHFGATCETAVAVEEVTNPPDPPPVEPTVRITELLPNPSGEDSGAEKIELFNYGSRPVEVTGWVLDDVASTDPISDNALVLPEQTIAPGVYVVITVPTGKFALNNTSGDVVSLFDAQKKHIDSASYQESTPENKTYSYFSDGWVWATATLGSANSKSEPEESGSEEEVEEEEESVSHTLDIALHEIYPYPGDTDSEFIELVNKSSDIANLDQVVIKIGDRSKALTDITIEPQGLVVLGSGDLPVQLRNSGQTVQLLYTDGELIDEVAYGTATKAHSYAYFEDGWLWTKSATRGEENVFIAIAEPSKPGPIAPQSTKKSATKPKSTSKTTAPSTAKKGVVAGAMAKAAQPPQNPPAQEQLPTAATDEEKQPTKDLSRYLGWLLLGTATVGGGMFGVYKYGFKKQLPF